MSDRQVKHLTWQPLNVIITITIIVRQTGKISHLAASQ